MPTAGRERKTGRVFPSDSGIRGTTSARSITVDIASQFIFSYVSALESTNFNARFESYLGHKAECEKCNDS
jgi:hypothetical protein